MGRIKKYEKFVSEIIINESFLDWIKSKITNFLQKVKSLKGNDYTNLMSSVLPKEIRDIIKQESSKYFNKKESKIFEENFFNLQLYSDQDIEKMSDAQYHNFLQDLSNKMEENPYFSKVVNSNDDFIKHLMDKGVVINNKLMTIAKPSMDNIRKKIEALNYGPIITKFLKSAAYFVFFSILLVKLTSCSMSIDDLNHSHDSHDSHDSHIQNKTTEQYYDQLALDAIPDSHFKSIVDEVKNIVNSTFQHSKLSDDVKNEISNHIHDIQIIKVNKADIPDKYKPGDNWNGFYHHVGNKDYIFIANYDAKLENLVHTLIHELMHLADFRTDGKYELEKNVSSFMNLDEIKKLVENPSDYTPKSSNFDNLKPEIQKQVLDSLDISTKPAELNKRLSDIIGNDSSYASGSLAKQKNWLSDPAEVYAEMRTMKLFLVTVKKLDSVNSDVTPAMIKDILNGGLKQSFESGRLNDQNWLSMILFLKHDDASIEDFCKYLNI